MSYITDYMERSAIDKSSKLLRKEYIRDSLAKISDYEIGVIAGRIVDILNGSLHTFIGEAELYEIKTKLDDIIRPIRERYGITYEELHCRANTGLCQLKYSLFCEDDEFAYRVDMAVYDIAKEIVNHD